MKFNFSKKCSKYGTRVPYICICIETLWHLFTAQGTVNFLCHFMGYRDNNLHHTSRCLSPLIRIYFFDVCDINIVLVLIFRLCVL